MGGGGAVGTTFQAQQQQPVQGQGQGQGQGQSQIQPTPQQQQHKHVVQQEQLPPPTPPSAQMLSPQPLPPQPQPLPSSQLVSSQPLPSQIATSSQPPQPPQQHQIHTQQHQQIIPASPAPVPSQPAPLQQFPPPPQPAPLQQLPPSSQPNMARQISTEKWPQQQNPSQSTAGQRPPLPPAQQQQQQQQNPQHHVSPAVSKLSQDTIAPRQLAPPLFQDTIDSQTQNALQGSVQASSTISQKHQRHQTPLLPQQPQIVVPPERPSSGTPTGTEQATLITQQGLIIDISEADTEEIRKLKQEFEKKMQRAQKSYGTRMDNLHRSKEEAEALHKAPLQNPEKDRTDFAKRVRLAEEEQARRLNQIQKEFNEKKEGVRHQQMDKAGAAIQRLPLTSTCSEGGGGALPPIP